jgi:predicted DNA-binding transcriptional regulator YafY
MFKVLKIVKILGIYMSGDNERQRKILYLIQKHQVVPKQKFLDTLEVSPATFKRDLEFLRNRMNAPIIYDHFHNGYCLDPNVKDYKIEMPGLWFSQSEATALALMEHLLSSLDQSGLLGPHIQPLRAIIDQILGPDTPSKELRKRIKVLGMFSRKTSIDNFGEIGAALLQRKKLQINFYSKGNNENTDREISPLRMIYYRDNWYLDAYCHLREGLRSFSIDGIRTAAILDSKAVEVSEKELKENFTESYGIFSGKATQICKLKFSPNRARWVSTENWHPQQVGKIEPDGSYILEFPFNQDLELIMDIMKYGSDVSVIEPSYLRTKILKELKSTLKNYP